MDEQKSWNSWSNHILTELKRLDKNSEHISEELKDMDERIQHRFLDLHTAVTELKLRGSIWGAVAGTVFGAAVSGLVTYLTGQK